MELAELFTEQQKAWKEFREELEKSRGASDEKLQKLNDRIDELQAKMQRPPNTPEKPNTDPTDLKEQDAYLRKGWGGLSAAGAQKAISVGSDPDGGYFVLPDTSGRIIRRIMETTPMRQYADVVTISTDALEGPIDNDEATSGWVGETTARAETNTPQIDKWRIPTFEQYAEPRATQKLLDDASVDVGRWLENKVSTRFARQENITFFTGNGITQPRGITTYPTAATADATRPWGTFEHINSGAAGAFAAANPADRLIDVIFALKSAYRTGAVWMAPKAVYQAARKFKDGLGNYIWQPGMVAGQPATLNGYPAVEAEEMPALANTSLSMLFGNIRETYTVVDRQGIRVLRDPFTAKPYVKFYTTKRVGGGALNFESAKFLRFAV